MIPRIIHYCWFGHKRKTKEIDNCIESWNKYFPDFEIKEWNEDNFDITSCAYALQAYKENKMAYVSDYVRMKVLEKYGGIYFDTDVEVLRKFPNELFETPFSGIEEFSKLISPGLVYACYPNDLIVKEMVKQYENCSFINTKIEEILTINKRITAILDNYGYIHEDFFQDLGVLKVYPSEVFCAYDGSKRRRKITENSLATHLYLGSWLPLHKKIRLRIGTALRHMGLIKRN